MSLDDAPEIQRDDDEYKYYYDRGWVGRYTLLDDTPEIQRDRDDEYKDDHGLVLR